MPSLARSPQGLDGLPDLFGVFRLRGIRRDPLVAYMALWHHAGGRPRVVTVDYLRLRVTLGGSEHGVRRWLASLDAAGLIDILERRPREAVIRVRDWRSPRQTEPTQTARKPHQLDLFAAEAPPPDDPPIFSIWSATKRTGRIPGAPDPAG